MENHRIWRAADIWELQLCDLEIIDLPRQKKKSSNMYKMIVYLHCITSYSN
jgi:hypothetical protein